jgi:hypothetical protein
MGALRIFFKGERQMGKSVVTALALVGLMASMCFAGVQNVTFTIEADTAAQTFQVFATTTNDGGTKGLSALELNIWADGGDAAVTSVVNETNYAAFILMRDDGTEIAPGVWYISGAQQTLYSGVYSSTKDNKVVKGIGLGAPTLVASGTYTGAAGTFHANIPAGSSGMNLLKIVDGTNWKGPGTLWLWSS